MTSPSRYPVSYGPNANRLTTSRWINVNAKTRNRLEKMGAELSETLSGGVKILKRNGKFVKSGQGSLSHVIAGKKNARRRKGAGPNDYMLKDFGIEANPKTTTRTRATRKKSTPESITINGFTGTPEDLRVFLGK